MDQERNEEEEVRWSKDGPSLEPDVGRGAHGQRARRFEAVHPALGNLSAGEHMRFEQEVYRRYGGIMPFFMTATVASAIPVLSATKDHRSAAFRLTLAGAACFAAMLGVTLMGNVPINRRRILELPAREGSYDEFLDLRRRWDRLHAVHNVLNVAGFALSCLGALSRSRQNSPASILKISRRGAPDMHRTDTQRERNLVRPSIDGTKIPITGASSGIGRELAGSRAGRLVLIPLVGFVPRFAQRWLARTTARQLRGAAS